MGSCSHYASSMSEFHSLFVLLMLQSNDLNQGE